MPNPRGRPIKALSAKNEIDCKAHYENYESAGYAASLLGLHRRTVEIYFQRFAAEEIEETNIQFIQRQRATKARVIFKLDELIAKTQAQMDRVELKSSDYSPEGINMERLLQKSITDMNTLLQDKASIEMTPTLDIHIEAEIEKKYGEPDKDNSIIKHQSK